MNPVCSVHLPGKKMGTITDMGGYHVVLTSDSYQPDDIIGRVTMQDTDDISELPKLSSCSHIITGSDSITYDGCVHKVLGTIHPDCRYKVLPIVSKDDIVDDMPGADPIYLSQGYAKEYRDAMCIVVPPTGIDMLMPDTLVKAIDGDTYTGYSGRTYEVSDVRHEDGRYVYPTSVTKPEGEVHDLPYTYTNDSLRERCRVLNDRLHTHAKDKVSSICASLEALSDRISTARNPYEASLLYDDVSSLLTTTRHLS